MKKIVFASFFLTTIALFQFCTSSKKSQNSAPKIAYTNHIQYTIAGNCSPCHVGANARSGHLDSYDAAKSHIDDIVRRISLNPTDKGFMPFKHAKLADSTIQVFVNWKNAGTPQ